VRSILRQPNPSRRLQRVLNMVLEHDMMHLETVVYMLVQTEGIKAPLAVAPQGAEEPAPPPTLLVVDTATPLVIGHDDAEDEDADQTGEHTFGWDNEHPAREHTFATPSFRVQDRPVTNGEYLAFVRATQHELPQAWTASWGVKTLFGPVPIEGAARNWPVTVSQLDAEAYAQWLGGGARLPTHAEHLALKRQHPSKLATHGFQTWTPRSVTFSMDRYAPQPYCGSVWEWSSTLFTEHPGFTASRLYPGYSSDFFDGKHVHVDGYGSWATHRRLATRSTFVNWYHRAYPYAFVGFRCAFD
jgi:formylglycine-generating enzyme required for sulfatase activity